MKIMVTDIMEAGPILQANTVHMFPVTKIL